MKARVCQLFEVLQHEYASFSLSCEGRFSVIYCVSVVAFSFFSWCADIVGLGTFLIDHLI